MWIVLSLFAAFIYGLYDTSKKAALRGNAVLPVLLLNTIFCSLILLIPLLLSGNGGGSILEGTPFLVARGGWHEHKYILLKSFIVLSSWISGYFAYKNLPLSIVGPVNATRPVMVLLGAMIVFGERLNLYQWTGALLAILSFYLLSRTSRKEGIDFRHDRWMVLLILSAVMGAVSGLYDRYLMAPPESGGVGLDKMMVLCWYNIYQVGIMLIVLLAMWYPTRKKTTPFQWRWSTLLISIFLVAGDFLYMYALSFPDSKVSVVSMVKRSSVIVSFTFAALVFKEKNLRDKALDLLLVLLGMVFLYLGSR